MSIRHIILLALAVGYATAMPAQNQKDMTNKPRVTGIGGIFFKCKDPKKMAQWYKDNLGIESDAYGHTFKWYEEKNSDKVGRTVWSPFPDTTDYFGDKNQQTMINYRVDNIDELVKQLKAKGVKIVDDVKDYEGIGKFAHIEDVEGNRIELWEPIEEHEKDSPAPAK